jgi:hypothetical protein
MTVFEFDSEGSVGKYFLHRAHHLNGITSHASSPLLDSQFRMGRLGHIARNVYCPPTALGTLQRDLTMPVPPGGCDPPLGGPLDLGTAAAGTQERFMISIRQDQLQSFVGPEFLDTATSH